MTPIQRALNYTEIHPPRPRSTRQSSWSPPARSIAWLEENQPPSLSDTSYKDCVKELKLPQHKAETLEKNIEKVMLMVARTNLTQYRGLFNESE